MSTGFRFNFDKSIEAVAVILREEPNGRMNYMKLLKLLAIAERESLKDTGTMITGDRIVAMDNGPLPSRIYDLIMGRDSLVKDWGKFLATERFDIRLATSPGVGHLSRYAIDKLQEVARRHYNDDEWAMVKITHRLEEWKAHQPKEGSSRKIPTEAILKAVGRSDEADAIIAEATQQDRFAQFFARHTECTAATPS